MVALEIEGTDDATGRGPEHPAPHAHSLVVGEVVAGKYRVDRFMDAGGMAQIFEATNIELDERVALKLPHPIFRERPELAARFREEAKALARVKSENVARVHDVVSTVDGDPVMVMEFLEGDNLARLMERRELPAPEERVGWIIEACSGVAVAHANGIVHRDMKPENIFIANTLGGRRTAKVLDFGISRLALATARRSAPPLKAAAQLVGSPMYMSPEQIGSPAAADPRIDVWCIGVVLFELLAGRPPFIGRNVDEVCERILRDEHPDIRDLCPGLDPELCLVVERCLQRDADARFPSVADLAVALLPFGPPRHATSVDQTVSVLRVAGLTNVEMPATLSLVPNAPDESKLRDSRPSSRTPATGRPPGAPTSTPTPIPPGFSRSAYTSALTDTQSSAPEVKPPPPRSRLPVIAAAAAIVAAVVVFFVMRGAPHESPPGAAAPSVSVRFETDPPDALLEIDGAVVGSSPAAASLPPGRHIVTLSKPGYERFSRVVEVSADAATAPLRFTLAPVGKGPSASAEPPAGAPPGSTADAESKPGAGQSAASPNSGVARVEPPASAAPKATSGGAVTPPPRPNAAPTAGPKATVRVIDDQPSKVKVIE